MKTKIIISLVLAVVIGAAIIGAYYYPVATHPAGSTTTAGGTFTSAKIAAISFAPATASATSSSILNPFGADVYVTSAFLGCENATTTYTAYTGAGLSNWIVRAATTSTAAPATVSNTNYLANFIIATGTTAAGTAGYTTLLISSSTIATSSNPMNFNQALGTAYQFLWPSGTYMTIWSNATNTAQCTVGVHVFSS